jgi:hypothetical protein
MRKLCAAVTHSRNPPYIIGSMSAMVWLAEVEMVGASSPEILVKVVILLACTAFLAFDSYSTDTVHSMRWRGLLWKIEDSRTGRNIWGNALDINVGVLFMSIQGGHSSHRYSPGAPSTAENVISALLFAFIPSIPSANENSMLWTLWRRCSASKGCGEARPVLSTRASADGRTTDPSTVGHSEGVARVSENQNSTLILDEFPTLFYFYLE